MVSKSSYKLKKSCVDLKFFSARNWKLETFVSSLQSGVRGWSKQKVKMIVFQIMLLYRLWHIRSFIHASLEIVYGVRLDATENGLWYTHRYQLFIINMIKHLLKSFHFQCLLLSKYLEITFYLNSEVFTNWLFLFFVFEVKNSVLIF